MAEILMRDASENAPDAIRLNDISYDEVRRFLESLRDRDDWTKDQPWNWLMFRRDVSKNA